jgi:CHRD domain-containing protein
MRKHLQWFVVLLLAIGLAAIGGVGYAAGSRTVTLTARLTGAQEVPPADPDGSGKAQVEIDVDAGQVCFDVKVTDTGTPNRGHIHSGAAGVNGPIVVPFFELRPGDAPVTDPRHDALEQGRLQDCVSASPTLLADIVAHPDLYYVNVHNTRFPGGAIRCQLEL